MKKRGVLDFGEQMASEVLFFSLVLVDIEIMKVKL
jgi:hypothetical protein